MRGRSLIATQTVRGCRALPQRNWLWSRQRQGKRCVALWVEVNHKDFEAGVQGCRGNAKGDGCLSDSAFEAAYSENCHKPTLTCLLSFPLDLSARKGVDMMHLNKSMHVDDCFVVPTGGYWLTRGGGRGKIMTGSCPMSPCARMLVRTGAECAESSVCLTGLDE